MPLYQRAAWLQGIVVKHLFVLVCGEEAKKVIGLNMNLK